MCYLLQPMDSACVRWIGESYNFMDVPKINGRPQNHKITKSVTNPSLKSKASFQVNNTFGGAKLVCAKKMY
jgi:hypothetical protein